MDEFEQQIVGGFEVLKKHGAKVQSKEHKTGVEFRVILPKVNGKGPVIVTHFEPFPQEVGGKIARKIKKGIKKVTKKIARSKVVSTLAKMAPALAAVPGVGPALSRVSTKLGGVQRAAKVARGDFSQELQGVKSLAGVVPGLGGKLGALASRFPTKNMLPAGARGALALASKPVSGGVVVKAHSGRLYRVVPL